MTILEAYEIGMAKVAELEATGIPVKKVPTGQREHNQEGKNKYLTPDRLPLDKYLHISFVPSSEIDWQRIFEAGSDLAKLGISFDTGAGGGQRDWEFDWSFSGPNTERFELHAGDDEGDESVCCDGESEVDA